MTVTARECGRTSRRPAFYSPSDFLFIVTSRNYVWTLNNYSDDDIVRLSTPIDGIKYLVFQREIGESGTAHLQGYGITSSPVRMGGFKQLLSAPRAHVEPRRGTHDDAYRYCTKLATRVDDTEPVEWGQPPSGSGSRSDLLAVAEAIREGRTAAEIFSQYPIQYLRYTRGINQAIGLIRPGRDRCIEPKVIVYVGPSGCGKSRRAAETYPESYWCTINESGRIWWQCYESQRVVVIDDFHGELPFRYLLRLLDRYSMYVEAKGCSLPLAGTTFVITSNIHPQDWYDYSGKNHTWTALQRRISELHEWMFQPALQIYSVTDITTKEWRPR